MTHARILPFLVLFLAGLVLGCMGSADPVPTAVMELPVEEPEDPVAAPETGRRAPGPAAVGVAAGSGGAATDPAAELAAMVDRVSDAIQHLPEGRILFNPPTTMKVGVTERVEVRIAREASLDLTEGLHGGGTPQVEPVKIGFKMKVRLVGNDFEIVTWDEEVQFVGNDTFAEWAYDVTPIHSGPSRLEVHATALVRIEGEEITREVPVLQREVEVEVNPTLAIRTFFAENWEFVLGTLLLPVAGWVLQQWFERRRKRED